MPNPHDVTRREPPKSAACCTLTILGRPGHSVVRLNEKTTLVKFTTDAFSTVIFSVEDDNNENMAAIFEAVARRLRRNYGATAPKKGS